MPKGPYPFRQSGIEPHTPKTYDTLSDSCVLIMAFYSRNIMVVLEIVVDTLFEVIFYF